MLERLAAKVNMRRMAGRRYQPKVLQVVELKIQARGVPRVLFARVTQRLLQSGKGLQLTLKARVSAGVLQLGFESDE